VIPTEPKPAKGLPTRPSVLAPEGRREWRRLTQALPPDLLTQVDRGVLAMACEAWADWVDATKDLRANGWSHGTDEDERIRRAAVMRMRTSREAYMALASKLGLSPVDRVRLALPVEREKTLDEMLG
jgi:P27 family predicted phage terminase small subunit